MSPARERLLAAIQDWDEKSVEYLVGVVQRQNTPPPRQREEAEEEAG